MILNRLRLKNVKGRHIAIGVSVLAHGVALAFFIAQPDKPKTTKMAMEFVSEPVSEVVKTLPDQVVEDPKPQKDITPSGGAASNQGDPGKKSQLKAASDATSNLNAILAMDLSRFRSNNIILASYTPNPIGNQAGIEPVEPDVHLSQATIDEYILEGRGYANRGNKSRGDGFRGIGTAGMGIGGGSGKGSGGGHCPPGR